MRLLLAIVLGALALPAAAQTPSRPHNVMLFVADGLRAGMVNEKTAPAMTALMAEGVKECSLVSAPVRALSYERVSTA